jgi:hypothetical protein
VFPGNSVSKKLYFSDDDPQLSTRMHSGRSPFSSSSPATSSFRVMAAAFTGSLNNFCSRALMVREMCCIARGSAMMWD